MNGLSRLQEPVPEAAAQAILQAFCQYHDDFKRLTRGAQSRFEQQDWHGVQRDSVERLDLYAQSMQRLVDEFRHSLLGEAVNRPDTWNQMRSHYARLIAGRDDLELAETFFNSASRRVFTTVGVDTRIEFVDTDFELPQTDQAQPVYRVFNWQGSLEQTLEQILAAHPFSVPYQDRPGDIRRAASYMRRHLIAAWGSPDFESAEVLDSTFFRNKGAYLVGRLRSGERLLPLVLALRHPPGDISLDAVLLSEDDASVVFSYTRSYFSVEADIPHRLVSFLRSILPAKRVAELYISIGYNKHGKTELYRDLLRHLERSHDRFVLAPGQRGMVMAVFTLPSYDVVFKVIKDRFPDPKRTTREEVKNRYQLVFKHDRAGRLVDAQEFEYLQFERSRFDEALLVELLETAGESVYLENGCVNIRHLYTERRMTPLDLYVEQAPEPAASVAVLDYGQAIKDLAATNIFPGDILLKNFGVTRHGRVVFYDYDELALLTGCKFRKLPQASDYEDEMSAEPWFYVGKDDIFPEEFRTFLGLPEPYRTLFLQQHGDLFHVDFWRHTQKRHRAGEVVDIFPYPTNRRLNQAVP